MILSKFQDFYLSRPIWKFIVGLTIADAIVGFIFHSLVAIMIFNLALAAFNVFLSICNLISASRLIARIRETISYRWCMTFHTTSHEYQTAFDDINEVPRIYIWCPVCWHCWKTF